MTVTWFASSNSADKEADKEPCTQGFVVKKETPARQPPPCTTGNGQTRTIITPPFADGLPKGELSHALAPSSPPQSKRKKPDSLPLGPASCNAVSGRKQAKKRAKRNSRRVQNLKKSQNFAFGDQEASRRVRQNALALSGVVHVDYDVNVLPAAKGGWVGLRGRFSGEKRIYSLDELLEGDPHSGRRAMKLFSWKDG